MESDQTGERHLILYRQSPKRTLAESFDQFGGSPGETQA